LIESDGRSRLERVFPEDPAVLAEMTAAAAALRRDTVERGRLVARAEGDYAPGFVLWDQHGAPARTGDLRGSPYVLNFIFTRCKAAEMCPASTASMAALGKALRTEGLAGKVRLVTLSFDPAHDSPGVLRAYAAATGLDPEHHRLLTGDREMIRDLMRQFGILVLEQDGTLVHNAATVVVSADGRIVTRRPGARFDPAELLPVLRRLVAPR
jgi:protein SCO1/2